MRRRQSLVWDSGKSFSSEKAGRRAGAQAAVLDPEANRVRIQEQQDRRGWSP